ncbi:Gfo/Idh/MocA family protein [Stappia sp. MMSF_3263]|uniref:Gfo/Idh/MocA family protein n=1 Tax=Stappia sp. MMSF_3263 TaxID=3046693 RepID=UPI00273E70B2|nr:Gfo/Idh/MocA family oxidoreductase [Stappia sp. MMSF_3263]
MKQRARIAVVGAGKIGLVHMAQAMKEGELAGVVDPSPETRDAAATLEAPWFSSLGEMLSEMRPDGVVVATPNRLHVPQALECVAAGVPVLVEKPLADTPAAARDLVRAAREARVPLLVGHHRRYNPLIAAARAQIKAGAIGRLVAVSAQCWFRKPDSYFDIPWRTQPGAGPMLTNLIHDIDLMRHLCGDVAAVQAQQASIARGHAVEDTAAVILRFRSGALATMTVSDAVVAPWSWELTAGENPEYPRISAACYTIGGTTGSLSLPDLGLWHYEGEADWGQPISRKALTCQGGDPLGLQMRHFCQVALGRADPLVPGEEGLATLEVLDAIRQAAESGRQVSLLSIGSDPDLPHSEARAS